VLTKRTNWKRIPELRFYFIKSDILCLYLSLFKRVFIVAQNMLQMNLTLKVLHDQFRLDIDTIANRPRHWTVVGVEPVHAFGGITVTSRDFKLVGDKNSLDDQDFILFFDLTCYFRGQVSFACGNAARFQRASKGSSQSPACGRDDIIERGCPGFGDLGRDLVVFGDFGMHPEVNRTFTRRQVSAPVRPFYPFNANV
jgi:hypothetical protein